MGLQMRPVELTGRVIKLRAPRSTRKDKARPRRQELAGGPIQVGDAVESGERRFVCVGEGKMLKGSRGVRGGKAPGWLPASWRMVQWEAPCLGCGALFRFWRAEANRPVRRKCGPCKEAKHADA